MTPPVLHKPPGRSEAGKALRDTFGSAKHPPRVCCREKAGLGKIGEPISDVFKHLHRNGTGIRNCSFLSKSGRRSELEWIAKDNFLGLVRLFRIQVVPTGIRLSGV